MTAARSAFCAALALVLLVEHIGVMLERSLL